MQTFQKHFKNELGNNIDIQVSSKPIDGVEGVLVTISGPNSTVENHITRLEAEALYGQLKLLLETSNQ